MRGRSLPVILYCNYDEQDRNLETIWTMTLAFLGNILYIREMIPIPLQGLLGIDPHQRQESIGDDRRSKKILFALNNVIDDMYRIFRDCNKSNIGGIATICVMFGATASAPNETYVLHFDQDDNHLNNPNNYEDINDSNSLPSIESWRRPCVRALLRIMIQHWASINAPSNRRSSIFFAINPRNTIAFKTELNKSRLSNSSNTRDNNNSDSNSSSTRMDESHGTDIDNESSTTINSSASDSHVRYTYNTFGVRENFKVKCRNKRFPILHMVVGSQHEQKQDDEENGYDNDNGKENEFFKFEDTANFWLVSKRAIKTSQIKIK